MNRIQAGIDRINEKLKAVPEAKKEELHKTLKTDFNDLVGYQRVQSAAFACGKLSLEEAQVLYQVYGGEVPDPEKWDKLSLGEKIIGTQTAAELIQMRVCNIL